jgi:hypothetical protein
MTLMEQYGAERRALAFSAPNALKRGAAFVLMAMLLSAIAVTGSAEDGDTRTDPDSTMERARRELGRALSERARGFEPRGQDGTAGRVIPIPLPEIALFPMPLGTFAMLQPRSLGGREHDRARVVDPTPFDGSATLGRAHPNRLGERMLATTSPVHQRSPSESAQVAGPANAAQAGPPDVPRSSNGQSTSPPARSAPVARLRSNTRAALNERGADGEGARPRPSEHDKQSAEENTRGPKSAEVAEAAPLQGGRIVTPPDVTGSTQNSGWNVRSANRDDKCRRGGETHRRPRTPASLRHSGCVISVRG